MEALVSGGLQEWRRREECALAAVGFEALERDLWKKDNTVFGRGAALQTLSQSSWDAICTYNVSRREEAFFSANGE